MNLRTKFAAAAGAALLSLSAFGQAYPAKPITMIVPFPPGGGTDGLARVVAASMSESLGQRIVIQNVGGAGGTIGTAAAARAQPDGYTIMMGTLATHSIAPSLFPKLDYDAERDFKPIANVAYLTNYVVVGPSLKVTDVADLVRTAKASPGKLKFASAGNGTPAHLAVELFKMRTGADVVHVPYRGGGPAIADLVGGHVDAIFGDPVSVLPHVKAGRLRALAVAGPKRSAALPDVPTTAEAGLPDFNVRVWHGVLAPAAVPPEIARRLADSVAASVRNPAVQQQLSNMGAEPADETLDAFGKVIQSERVTWGAVVKAANVKPD